MKCRKIDRAQGARVQKKQQLGTQEALLQTVYRLHQQGRKQKACRAYEDFISHFPRHSEALGNYGLLLHGMGKQAEAVDLYQRALHLSPQSGYLYYYLGNGLRELGRPQEAIAAYEKALSDTVHQDDVLLNLGQTYLDDNQPTKARRCFETLQERNPESRQATYHLGLLFFQQNDFEQAVQCFSWVCEQHQDHIDARFNLALCYKAMGRIADGLDVLVQANKIAQGDADILYNIGVLYRQLGDPDRSEEYFVEALNLEPENGICLTDLAILYHTENRQAEAKAMYERAVACGYESESARHMLSALSGETTHATPLGHVRNLFNNYAPTFDKSLENDLNYNVPRQLAQMVRRLLAGKVFASGVDLGCGTGLSGLEIRECVAELTGVDLAENMLAIAASKKIYDSLHCTDILDFVTQQTARFELVFAADVFVYLGKLEPLFQHLGNILHSGGFVVFSVETCPKGYCLRESGRYAHSGNYIVSLGGRYGFTIHSSKPASIRKERGKWIAGELFVMQYDGVGRHHQQGSS